MISLEELKEDINFNFGIIPIPVRDYINRNADRKNQYVTFIYLLGDNVIFRTWAFKDSKGLEYTEVERKVVGSDLSVRRNIYLTTMAGYRPVYSPQVHASGNWYGYSYYYFSPEDFNVWSQEKPMGLYSTIINKDVIFEIDKFEYCGYSGQQDLFTYLNAYIENPKVEYFGKMGLIYSKSLMKKVEKDKQFIQFLKKNVKEVNLYGSQISIYAYDKKISFAEAEDFLIEKREADKATAHFSRIKEKGINRIKIYEYAKNVGLHSYRDYWEAIAYIGMDLTDTKNTMPYDFMRMHDLRISEYASKKASEEINTKRQLTRNFKKNVTKYKATEIKDNEYCIVLPVTPRDLVKEGNALHHCVGRMGYDKKVAEGKSLIGFIRLNNAPDVPYVTVEYLIKEKKISQVYGDHDSRPAKEVYEFAEKWGKAVRKNE